MSVLQKGAERRRVLILVENLPSPFDRRVWQEATTLAGNGYEVSIICPTGKGFEKKFEVINGIHIYRYNLPFEAKGAKGYAIEYSVALFWTFVLSLRVLFTRGFDVVHACNPPDLLFLIGGFYKLVLRKCFLFDHHDINPELYEAKFGRRDFLYRMLRRLERWSFRVADVSIATNESYRKIAIERCGMPKEKVWVVRSGPKLDKWRIQPPNPSFKKGRRFLVGYVGVMGQQEGIEFLLQAARHIVHDKKREDVQFVLVGGGPMLEDMRALSRTLQVDDYVTFTGRVSDEELLEALNTADVCVNPDVANEMNDKSTMNKIMEYMALGKPIVQFDLVEGRFSAREASIYVKRNDAIDMARGILELLADPERRAAMGAFGRRRVEHELEWRHEAPKLLAAYDVLFGGAASKPGLAPARPHH
ncbi:MAG TPA: glycosyltransferase family 4 protein [Noviherbaspirillum sp.]|nr:glycosyltransferase family 4 protein [Noviherbaspirillum sp.]